MALALIPATLLPHHVQSGEMENVHNPIMVLKKVSLPWRKEMNSFLFR